MFSSGFVAVGSLLCDLGGSSGGTHRLQGPMWIDFGRQIGGSGSPFENCQSDCICKYTNQQVMVSE